MITLLWVEAQRRQSQSILCLRMDKIEKRSVNTQQKFEIVFGKHESSGLTIRGVTQLVISTQLKACISDGTGVHLCLCNWQPVYLGRHHQCWNVYRGFRATQHRSIRQEWGSIPLAEVQLLQTFAEKVVVHSGKRETVQTFLRLGLSFFYGKFSHF